MSPPDGDDALAADQDVGAARRLLRGRIDDEAADEGQRRAGAVIAAWGRAAREQGEKPEQRRPAPGRQTTPKASIASATFLKPAMLAPFT